MQTPNLLAAERVAADLAAHGLPTAALVIRELSACVAVQKYIITTERKHRAVREIRAGAFVALVIVAGGSIASVAAYVVRNGWPWL